jgi:hypothetical protein
MSYLYCYLAPLPLVMYSATHSVGYRQSAVSDVQGRNIVSMLLIDLVEKELGPILSWPTDILSYLFVDVPNPRIVEELSAFIFW